MFCACLNNADEQTPNTNICPVCMAHPGALPVINREAVKKVFLVGVALKGKLGGYTEFDRKNYFYPDIPKGYQISQYQHPLVSGGALSGIAITRVHLEEDTARSQHLTDRTLIDFNRAGVPLMELVTEPVIESAEQAGAFARELQLLLRYLDVSEANMEKGELRVEANISVAKTQGLTLDQGSSRLNLKLGTKVEIKNLNSFRSVERAVAYEIKRQSEVLERGENIMQETRGWDEGKQATFSQRKKESSHDYRYFPDPDLPSLALSEVPEFSKELLQKELPELPSQKRERLQGLGFLQNQDVEQLMNDFALSQFFDQVAKKLQDEKLIKVAANFILNDIAGERKKNPAWPLPAEDHFVTVVRSYSKGDLPSPQAKNSILSGVMAEVADAAALPDLAAKIINANPHVVADYKAGKQTALQFLVGQGMKESRGSANPEKLREQIIKVIG